MVEGDVGFFAVFWAQAREIGAFRQYRFRMLDFIDEYETGSVISGKSCTDFLAEGDCISAEKKFIRFKVDFNNMVCGNATVKQMLLEKIKEKKTLTTTPHSN